MEFKQKQPSFLTMPPFDFLRLPMTPPDPAEPIPPTTTTDTASVVTAIHVIATERAALAHLEHLYQTDKLAQENLGRAVGQIVKSIRDGGKVVVCGVGKSGKIGRKLEATMNSVGVYSGFLHPTEALHGDLGMVRPNDTLLLISFSGRTPELLLLLPHIPPTVPVIAITSHLHPSTCPLLSFHSSDMGILLPAPIHEDEESSFGLSAPTSSTTVALSLGDALAIAAARRLHTEPGRGPAEVFKSFHPGGAIGAAFAASTPMSMSTTSFSSSDYLAPMHTLSPAPETPSPPPPSTSTTSPISDLLTPLSQIPTISKASPQLLDILLTAIQHPTSKSWVLLSQSLIIPPTHLRTLSQTESNIDKPVSDLGTVKGRPIAIAREDWLQIPAEATISKEQLRRLVSEARVGCLEAAGVVAVMRESECLGVVEFEELRD